MSISQQSHSQAGVLRWSLGSQLIDTGKPNAINCRYLEQGSSSKGLHNLERDRHIVFFLLSDQEKDKLVALAGLAKQFQSIVKSEYVAGMWRNDIEWALRWHSTNHFYGRSLVKNNMRLPIYAAPIWSWAAVDGFITHSTK